MPLRFKAISDESETGYFTHCRFCFHPSRAAEGKSELIKQTSKKFQVTSFTPYVGVTGEETMNDTLLFLKTESSDVFFRLCEQ